LANPSWNRLFHVYDAFKTWNFFRDDSWTSRQIDRWFSWRQIENWFILRRKLKNIIIDSYPAWSHGGLLRKKVMQDRQIAHLLDCLENAKSSTSAKEMGIKRSLEKLVEYLRSRIWGTRLLITIPLWRKKMNPSIFMNRQKVVVLGSDQTGWGKESNLIIHGVHGVLAAKGMRLWNHHDQL